MELPEFVRSRLRENRVRTRRKRRCLTRLVSAVPVNGPNGPTGIARRVALALRERRRRDGEIEHSPTLEQAAARPSVCSSVRPSACPASAAGWPNRTTSVVDVFACSHAWQAISNPSLLSDAFPSTGQWLNQTALVAPHAFVVPNETRPEVLSRSSSNEPAASLVDRHLRRAFFSPPCISILPLVSWSYGYGVTGAGQLGAAGPPARPPLRSLREMRPPVVGAELCRGGWFRTGDPALRLRQPLRRRVFSPERGLQCDAPTGKAFDDS